MKAQFYPWSYQQKQATLVDETTGEKTYERSGRKLYGIVWTEPSGKVHKERSGYLTLPLARQAVEKKRREVQEAQAKGFETVEGPREVVTLKRAAQDYIDVQGNADTRSDYQGRVDNFLLPILGNVPLATIKAAQVMAYIDARKKSGAAVGTLKKELAVLSGIFSAAQLRELVDSNPVTLARKGRRKALKQGKKLVRFLSRDEETRLYAVLPPRTSHYANGTNVQGSILRDAIPFALLTGLREQEQVGLTWADYVPERKAVRIMEQKNGNQDELPLCDAAVAILERLRKEAMKRANGTAAAIQKLAIFADPDSGKAVTRFNNTGWSRALVKAGIESFRWHDLRHTFASRLGLAGVSLQTMQKRMRHGSINMTMIYSHLTPEDNPAGAAGIDFQGRKDVRTLDCYQNYDAVLFPTSQDADVLSASTISA